MKLLYIAPPTVDINRMDGVAKKILNHVKSFSNEFDVLLLYRDPKNVMIYRSDNDEHKFVQNGKSKFDILNAAKKLIDMEQIDCCYIRYPNSDPYFLSLLKKMKSKRIRIVIEIPTYPYDKEGLETLKGYVIRSLDIIYRKKLKKYVDRIITYSKDDKIYGIDTIKTINGVDFDKISLLPTTNQKVIYFCAVAMICRTHGYDRLINGLFNYYKNGGKREIIIDIVGTGEETIRNSYIKLVNELQLENRVIFHGLVNGEKLDEIYARASIGVNSLAIHRQNLVNESTLKTKEYAAKGLPILSSSYVDAFSETDNLNYVCRVPANDSAIDLEKVIDFYDYLLLNKEIDLLRNEIRYKSQSICDMHITLKPVVEFLKSNRQ